MGYQLYLVPIVGLGTIVIFNIFYTIHQDSAVINYFTRKINFILRSFPMGHTFPTYLHNNYTILFLSIHPKNKYRYLGNMNDYLKTKQQKTIPIMLMLLTRIINNALDNIMEPRNFCVTILWASLCVTEGLFLL
uniref:Uncharacterized protein n=2 Tax=Cacopsylla melanoneura TaxID=428564 RepID=A0A8D8QQ95_9HEMI